MTDFSGVYFGALRSILLTSGATLVPNVGECIN